MRRMLKIHHRAALVGLVLIGCALSIQAQSGRRSTSKPTTPAPSVDGPKKVEGKPEKQPRLQFLLIVENPNPFNQTPYYLSDTVVEECARHLEEAANVLATVSRDHLNRAEAAKAAKVETDRYVVWLQLGNDTGDAGRSAQNAPDQLYVSYVIYEPTTAKTRASGRTYHSIVKVGNVGVSGPTSSRRSTVYAEETVKRAAREAAERILNSFGIKIEDQRMPL